MKAYDKFLKAAARRNTAIKALWPGMSKSAIARKYHISRERVRQIINGKPH